MPPFSRTPLQCAAYGGHINAMSVLLENGGNMNAQDNEGISALHWACSAGRLDAVKLLVEYGAYPNQMEADGDKLTPLDYALIGVDGNAHEDVVSYLVEHGGLSVSSIKEVAAVAIQIWWRKVRGIKTSKAELAARRRAAAKRSTEAKAQVAKKEAAVLKEEQAKKDQAAAAAAELAAQRVKKSKATKAGDSGPPRPSTAAREAAALEEERKAAREREKEQHRLEQQRREEERKRREQEAISREAAVGRRSYGWASMLSCCPEPESHPLPQTKPLSS